MTRRFLALLVGLILFAVEPAFAADRIAPEQSGTLVGNRGGSFATYEFEYPGDGSTVSLELSLRPPAPGAGMNLYGPGGKLYGTGNKLDLTSGERGTYVVQLFNYDPASTVGYVLTSRGVQNVAPAAAPPAEAQPPPGAPSGTQNDPFKGTLVGNRAGSFVLFEFDYPGENVVYTLNLQVGPQNAATEKRAGFNIYAPNGQLALQGAPQPGKRPNVSGQFSARAAGTYTVQIFNYGDVPIDYEVSLDAPR